MNLIPEIYSRIKEEIILFLSLRNEGVLKKICNHIK